VLPLLTAGETASRKCHIRGQFLSIGIRWAIFDVLDAIPTEHRRLHRERAFSASASLKTMLNITALVEQAKKENAQRHTELEMRIWPR